MSRLKPFHGSKEEGYKVALLDADQHVIRRILLWRGNPLKRTTMSFKIEFEDNDVFWVPYSKDLDESVQYGTFIEEHPMLFPLRYKVERSPTEVTALRKRVITLVQPDDIVYVELRCALGLDWYNTLSIPCKYEDIYVVVVQYIRWRNAAHKFIPPKVLVLDEVMADRDNYDVFRFGTNRVLSDPMHLIDESFVLQHPEIINPRNKERLLRLYS